MNEGYLKEIEEKKKLQEQILQIEITAQKYMTQEAISRYGTLKSAHLQKSLQAISFIAQLAMQNQIAEKITDEQFKQLLLKLEPEKRETKIIRK